MAKPQYGAQHQARRKALLPYAYGTPCPMCGMVMLPSQALDFDHSTPVAEGGRQADRFAHASCNRAAGGRLAAERGRRELPSSGSF